MLSMVYRLASYLLYVLMHFFSREDIHIAIIEAYFVKLSSSNSVAANH